MSRPKYLPKMAKDEMMLPYYHVGQRRWLFLQKQPSARSTFKIGRWLVVAVALYIYFLALQGIQ